MSCSTQISYGLILKLSIHSPFTGALYPQTYPPGISASLCLPSDPALVVHVSLLRDTIQLQGRLSINGRSMAASFNMPSEISKGFLAFHFIKSVGGYCSLFIYCESLVSLQEIQAKLYGDRVWAELS